MPHDDTTLTMLRTDAALRAREARIVELERELARMKDDWRGIIDLLSAQPETVAGQTLVEALQAVLAERDRARKVIQYALTALNGYVPVGADRAEEARQFLLRAYQEADHAR